MRVRPFDTEPGPDSLAQPLGRDGVQEKGKCSASNESKGRTRSIGGCTPLTQPALVLDVDADWFLLLLSLSIPVGREECSCAVTLRRQGSQ